MRALALLPCMALAACAPGPGPSPDWDVASAAVPHVAEYLRHGPVPDGWRTYLRVRMVPGGSLGSAVVGHCLREARPGALLHMDVRLDGDYWAHATPYEQESLVLHELGHCLGGMRHRGRIDELEDAPTSLMYPYVLRDEHRRLRAAYLAELADPGRWMPWLGAGD